MQLNDDGVSQTDVRFHKFIARLIMTWYLKISLIIKINEIVRKLRSEMTLRERKILERYSVSHKLFFCKNCVRFNKTIVSKKWRKEDDPEWEKLNETKREKTEENDINSFLLTLNISNYQSRYNKIRRRLGLRDPNDQIYSSRVHVRIYSRVSTESRPVQRRRA